MNPDQALRIASILQYILAAVIAVMGVGILLASLMTFPLTILALIAAVGVVDMGRLLARRQRRGYCLAAAVIECLAFPLGTLPGVVAILVLMSPRVKALYEPPQLEEPIG